MTQDQRREYLLRALLDESPRYGAVAIPKSPQNQWHLLRGLMNSRMPLPTTKQFLEVQDAFLQEELAAKGVTDGEALPPVALHPKLAIWRGDITTLKVDAIVNAANSGMLGCFAPNHGCIDNAIHTYAGVQLRSDCHAMMEQQGHEEPTGAAKITKAYNLPSSHVIHTVGPIIYGRLTQNDCDLLALCYRSCLELAAENKLSSIAFCCISTGEFHFPQERAAEIAIHTVIDYLSADGQIKKVIFNVFSEKDHAIYNRLLGEHEKAQT